MRLFVRCHRKGCEQPACWQPDLVFKTIGSGIYRDQIKMRASYKVCEDHKQWAADRLNSNTIKGQIARFIMRDNWRLPDFSTAKLEFNRIDPGAFSQDDTMGMAA